MSHALARCRTTWASMAAALLVVAPPAAAQQATGARLMTPGSFADDSARLKSITDSSAPAYPLLRSASSLALQLPGKVDRFRVALIAPELYLTRNSALPFSLNDGALWAGRGLNFRARAGFRAEGGPLRIVVAPELLKTQNLPFEMPNPRVVRPRPPGWSPFSSPWHTGPESIDLPIRFGASAFGGFDFGQSTLAVDAAPVTFGFSSENEWWGPGIRNAIVMSTNAAGIPRLFLRTTTPIATRLGTLDARLFAGGLRESPYFDTTTANDLRFISAFAVTWTPPHAPGVTLGLTRAVYGPTRDWSRVPLHLLDALFRDPGRPSNHLPGDTVVVPGADQVFSLFGRWVLPGAGLELYAEWARTELPASIRDFLTAPNHTQGYTLGLQWAQPVGRTAVARVQLETTYLEKDATLTDRPVGTWYTSRAVPQGYTNLGQVIGAAIGPGASSQWLATDLVAPDWSVGAFASRVRWDGEALYTFPTTNFYGTENKYCSHDTSVLFGVRGALRTAFGLLELTYDLDQRLNVFFYMLSVCGPDMARSDVHDALNHTIQVRLTMP